MEKYVVSRELAEKLKAARYPQNTEYSYWLEPTGNSDYSAKLELRKRTDKYPEYQTSTPLSDELLEQLFGVLTLTIRSYNEEDKFVLIEVETIRGNAATSSQGKPADCLAELWLWCAENGYVETGHDTAN